MGVIVVQAGHAPPNYNWSSGAPGEMIWNRTAAAELAGADGEELVGQLRAKGHEAYTMGAEPSDLPVSSGDIFISLHYYDVSAGAPGPNPKLGYGDASLRPHPANSRRWAQRWLDVYSDFYRREGRTGPVRGLNYTVNLSRYYMWHRYRLSGFKYGWLGEHGMSTEQDWLYDRLPQIMATHVDVVGEAIGHPIDDRPTQPPPFPIVPPKETIVQTYTVQDRRTSYLIAFGAGRAIEVQTEPAGNEAWDRWAYTADTHDSLEELTGDQYSDARSAMRAQRISA